jgi:putative lipoic acid-binding regulatory protein
MNKEEILQFPCNFPIKVMGQYSDDFVRVVVEIVLRHAPDFSPATMQRRPSSQGNYLGLTCTICATSREQLDALYRELSAHPLAKYVI